MSTVVLMIPSLMTSYILCIFMNSWLIIWILMEMNTLSFCCLAQKMKTNSKKTTKENIMKYFIIQSMASSTLIMSASISKMMASQKSIMMTLLSISLLIKMAAAPFYQWMIKMSKEITWEHNSILLTWQKLAPTFLLLYQKKEIILISILLSSIFGSLLLLNKKNMKEILALSSLFNIGWMLAAISMNVKTFMLFVLAYWTTTLSIILMMWKKNQESMNTNSSPSMKKEILLLAMVSLGGIPPLLGFMFKWIILKEMLSSNLKLMSTFLLTMSVVNLYIYLRMINPALTQSSPKNQKSSKPANLAVKSVVMTSNLIPLPFIFM